MRINFNNYDAVEILEKVESDLGVDMNTSCQRTEFPIPPSIGSGQIATYLFKDGLAIFLFNGQLDQDWEWEFQCKEDSPAFIFFSLSGQVEDDKKGKEENFVLNPLDTLLVTQPGGSRRSMILKKGEPIRLAILRLDPKRFFHKKACSAEELPEEIRKLFAFSGQEIRCHIPPNRSTEMAVQIVSGLLDSPYSGLIRTCYVEAKARELLSWTLYQLDKNHSKPVPYNHLTKYETLRLEKARKILIHDLKAAPTIKELSKKVGINQQALKQGFKRLFNKTIYQYLLEQRMETAKKMMLSQKYPVWEVAEAVGYCNASHFARRFKEHFGVLPSRFVSMIWRDGQEN
ncbi:MAG: AraC family transcriptional regulator [Bacteroidota bacterium]